MTERKWLNGFVTLPCFKIRTMEGTNEATFVCADWLVKVWSFLFAPFWKGGIYIYEEEDDDASSDAAR